MMKFEVFFATVSLSLLLIVGAVPVKKILRKGNATMELECRFGNFCDQFVAKNELERRSNCVQFFLAVYRRRLTNGSTHVKATT